MSAYHNTPPHVKSKKAFDWQDKKIDEEKNSKW